jgi:hypothetical protein
MIEEARRSQTTSAASWTILCVSDDLALLLPPSSVLGTETRKLSQGLPESVIGASSMFTGEEEIFAFARCCSRLVQMGSKEWAETAGRD